MASYVGNKPLFGNFDKLDDISSSFNGSANTFAMTSNSRGVTAGDETQVVISLNGVIQEPVTDYFLATTGQIQFTTAPASGTSFFGYVTGNIGGTASTITDGIVTTAKLANTAGTGSAVQLAANTSTLYITSNGRVGVGETSPDVALHVHDGSGAMIESPGAQAYLYLYANDRANNYDRRYIATENNGDFTIAGFGTGQWAKHLVVSSGGNVGIGTASPTAQNGKVLHIHNSSGATDLRLTNNTTGTAIDNGTILTLSSSTAYLYNYENADFVFGTNNLERMRIDSSGNVGIGETAPANLLHVKASDTGIAPHSSAQIVLEREGTNYLQFLTAETGTSGILFGDGSDVDVAAIKYDHNTTSMQFVTEASEAMRIDSSGDLLVGKTTDAFGTAGTYIGTDGLQVTRSAGSPVFLNRLSSDGTLTAFYKDGSNVGAIGYKSTDLFYIGSGDTTIAFYKSGDAILPRGTDGAARTNTIDLGNSGSRFKDLYLSGGAYLGGTAAANLLDDYEEGTWTPVYRDQNGNDATMYNSYGYYTKVGRLVTLHFSARTQSLGSIGSSASIRIAGLPFTAINSSSDYSAGITRTGARWGGWIDPPVSVFAQNGQGYLTLWDSGTDVIRGSDMNTGSNKNILYVEISYLTS